MRRPPPPHPRGTPRTPGSGRRRGTPNRRTVEMRQLMTSLCDDVDYQYRLRADFRRRRVHPTIEALVWGHVVGRPAERVQLSADITMNKKLDEERELFLKLDVQQLEALAAESQALVDKAMAMVKANALAPDDVASRRASVKEGDSNAPNSTCTGTDLDCSGDGDVPLNRDRGKAHRNPILVAISPSPAAGVDNAATGEQAEQSAPNSDQRDASRAETPPRDRP